MRRIAFLFSVLLLLTISLCLPVSSLAGTIQGIVSGPRGLVANARVHLLQQGRELRSTSTDERGRFTLAGVPAGDYQLQVSSQPHLPVVRDATLSADSQTVELNLVLQFLSETVTVTAARVPTPVVSSISNTKILAGEDLRALPYQSLEERLRSFPEFSLFRRTSSLVAHPTTQGVSLRGIGPSGVSRSLVLADGIPLNDAFGGWVYWDRIPSLSLAQAEISNGGGSTLYGNYALGGVVQLLKRVPEPATVEFQAQGGSNASLKGDLYASHRIGPWGVSLSAAAFDFDGYTLVAESQRGSVDIPAFSRHQAARFFVEHAAAGSSRVWFLEGGFLNEYRGNGTPVQNNDTTAVDFATGIQFSPRDEDRLEIRSFFRRNIFASTFSSVTFPDRNSERLTNQQHNPSADGGVSVLWFGARGAHRILAGADLWLVDGQSTDNIFFPPQRFALVRVGGGRQATLGFFGEENYAVSSRLTLVVGGRVDVWKNYDGRQGNSPPEGPRRIANIGGRTEAVFSPRVGFSFQANPTVTLYGSLARSFRAPTLNELYRQFTVGNVVTMANTTLVPERNTGGEVGLRFQFTENWRAGLAGFFNVLTDPVSNVTIQMTPTQIIRQRRNLGEARVYGLELSSSWQLADFLKTQVFYLWDQTRVAEFPADPALVDKRLQQVPEHRFSFTTQLSLPRGARVDLIGRFVGDQYDDDLNQIVLYRYFQLDMQFSQELSQIARLFVSLENLTNSRPLVNRSPVDFLGAPFQARGGLHLRFGHR
ncbi:MAG: TonB-dependent receptor [Acidobacteria bacterium]|nr:TonB-dependent receptor [Acidobacteriota bacterium]